MIIITLIIGTLGLFLVTMFSHHKSRQFLIPLFVLIFIASLTGIIANDYQHFGMTKTTTTQTKSLASTVANPKADLLLYHPLGNGKEKVYLYATADQPQKMLKTPLEDTHIKINRTTKKAQLVTQKTYWTYQSKSAKFWFGLAKNDQQLIKRQLTFEIPHNWLIMSDTKAKALQQK